MKILYFHQHFSTPNGSTGIRSYEMAKALMKYGHNVTVVCGRYAAGATGLSDSFSRGLRSGYVDGLHVIEFDLPYSNSDGFIKRSLSFIKYSVKSTHLALTENYDILFASSTPLTAGIPGIFARWIRGKTFVFEVRDLWPELPKAMGVIRNPFILKILDILEWLTYRSAHRLIGLAPGIVEGIITRGVDSSRIKMIPNGCDFIIFSQPYERWRPPHVKPKDFMAVFTGTHGIANGLDVILSVATELKIRRRDEIKLVLIGDGKLKPSLQIKAQQLNLDNVVFLDPVNKKKLAGLMAEADLGLQILANFPAFYYGTSPNKFFDYIAAGLPVLNNYPGWIAEMINMNGCGYTISPENPIAFADALIHASENRSNLLQMGINAKALAIREFRRDDLAKSFVEWVILAN